MGRGAVLIADDDPRMRDVLRTRLTAAGYDVLECEDGLCALVKAKARPVNAIILDHQMPLGEGRSIARNLRVHTRAPIIFLSGHAREEFREIVMKSPDTYYLAKPVDGTRLVELLDSLIGAEAGATV